MRAVPVVSNRRVICGPVVSYTEEDILSVVSRTDVTNVVPASVPVAYRISVLRPNDVIEDSSRSATNDMTVETNTLSFLSVMRTSVARPTIAI